MNLDIEIVNSIQDICKRYNFIEKVIIFGSRARGDNDVKSDIDIAVYSKKPILEFIEDVEMNTRTLLEFDFSHMNSIQDEFFVEQVTKEGIIIYEKC
ncbi:nucleotidyltransferase domain-containing protein [Clostridium botulinum]|uniref:Nucleotidyltransferase domain-containing protein n=1 Tax=Clostridium botulinum TaxID=1491 RepID=A0A6B4HPU6_CLOBO|nr:nucleotidyltransferase domain-containing protein [Clostridium botulinum]KAI3349119.1 nucleotidyltransferase domain-containing protein [Clostridium botulinum]MBN1049433.1 nucleotidyltransferase domain-containing protein [Clostridium botulinum]MBN1059301.1 nucleotidyltransferase domain-containing protein [Clostridium botulinum]MBN1065527.1 nucleotidyltransferase domain-containing protein [Clostridium botulinum]MCS6111314.1 nucleotidyltransferase domain-containing protein [Clostridium botulinu